jgi:hypothetical protein
VPSETERDFDRLTSQLSDLETKINEDFGELDEKLLDAEINIIESSVLVTLQSKTETLNSDVTTYRSYMDKGDVASALPILSEIKAIMRDPFYLAGLQTFHDTLVTKGQDKPGVIELVNKSINGLDPVWYTPGQAKAMGDWFQYWDGVQANIVTLYGTWYQVDTAMLQQAAAREGGSASGYRLSDTCTPAASFSGQTVGTPSDLREVLLIWQGLRQDELDALRGMPGTLDTRYPGDVNQQLTLDLSRACIATQPVKVKGFPLLNNPGPLSGISPKFTAVINKQVQIGATGQKTSVLFPTWVPWYYQTDYWGTSYGPESYAVDHYHAGPGNDQWTNALKAAATRASFWTGIPADQFVAANYRELEALLYSRRDPWSSKCDQFARGVHGVSHTYDSPLFPSPGLMIQQWDGDPDEGHEFSYSESGFTDCKDDADSGTQIWADGGDNQWTPDSRTSWWFNVTSGQPGSLGPNTRAGVLYPVIRMLDSPSYIPGEGGT